MSDAENAVSKRIVQYKGREKEFQDDESVIDFTVKTGVTTIARWAFRGCSNLRTLNEMIGTDTKKVEYIAFSRCRSLESLEGLPSELEEIGHCAFQDSGIRSLIGLPEEKEIKACTFWISTRHYWRDMWRGGCKE